MFYKILLSFNYIYPWLKIGLRLAFYSSFLLANMLVAQIDPVIDFSDITINYGDANFSLDAMSNSTGDITYSVIDGDAGSISLSGLNGEQVTILSAGTINIRATQEADAGFNLGSVEMTLIINKATLTVKARSFNREYGDTNEIVTVFEYSGFKNDEGTDGDTNINRIDNPSGSPIGSIAVSATTTANAGTTHAIIVDVSGLSSTNYSFASDNTGLLTVIQALITVKAQGLDREYGEANEAVTVFEYSGFKNGEGTDGDININGIDNPLGSPTGSIAVSATTTANAGTSHAITVDASGISSTNYNFTNDDSGLLSVAQATVNVTADDNTRTYGDDEPDFTISYNISDFKNGEDASVINTDPVATTTALGNSDIGTYPINLSGGSDVNYNFTFTSGILTITQAILIVKAQAVDREYGEANEVVTVFEYSGFKNYEGTDGATNIDGIDSSLGSPSGSIAASATVAANAGTTHAITIDVSGLSSTNYSFTNDDTGALTVTQATIGVTAGDNTRIYGDDEPAFTFTYNISDFKNGEDASVIDIDPVANTTALKTSDVGTYPINLSEGSAINYNFSFTSGTLTITQSTLTVKAQSFNREYGDTNEIVTVYEYSGFKNNEGTDGDTNIDGIDNPLGSPSGTIATAATLTANAGTTHAITVDVSALSSTNYSFTSDNTGLLTVVQAPITVTARDVDREYGEANETVTVFEYSGFKNSEGIDGETNISGIAGLSGSPSGIIGINATFTANAGSTHAITVDLSGLSSTNYSFISDNTGLLTVTQATVSVTADDKTRVYGDEEPGFTITYNNSDFKNGEDESVIGTDPIANTTALRASDTGNYPINLSGGSDVNYKFTFTDGTLTVTQAPITVRAQVVNREYGEANEMVTVFEYSGFKNSEGTDGDTNVNGIDNPSGFPSGTIAGSATLTAPAGSTHAITIDVSALSSTNYSFTSDNTGLLTVTQAPLTVKAGAVNREYGELNETVTIFEYSGFKNSEGIDGETNISGIDNPLGAPSGIIAETATPTASAATTHAITVDVSGLSSTNYSFTGDNTGLLTVTQASMTVKARAVNREYGESNQTVMVFEYSGFKNGEGTDGDTNVTGIDSPLGAPSGTIAATATPTAPAGSTHAITIDVSALSSTNYSFTSDNTGLLNVTQAPLTVKAQAVNREYGEPNETVTVFEYFGFKNNEGTDGDTNISGIDNPTGSPSGIISDSAPPTASAATTHAITVDVSGLSSTNYSFTGDNTGLLTVTKASLIVKARNVDREYGEANETVTVFEYSGFKNSEGTDGDTNIDGIDTPSGTPIGIISATALPTATAGTTHVITVDVSALSSNNYSFAGDNTGLITVTQAPLTVKAQAVNREYGEANETVTVFEYSGFKNSEGTDWDTNIDGIDNPSGTPIGTIADSATPIASAATTHNITVDVSALEATNYSFTSDDTGLLTVTQATIGVTADDNTRFYGDQEPTFTITYNSDDFKNGEDEGVIGTDPQANTTASRTSPVGTYPINLSGGSDINYNFIFTSGALTITQAPLTVKAQAVNREYGEANQTVTIFEYSGFKNSEGTDGDTNIDGIDNPLGIPIGIISATALPTANAATTHTITIDVSGLFSTNYSFASDNSGLLTVTQAPITVKAEAVNREYGEPNEAVTVFEYSGFKNSEGTDGDTHVDGIENPSGSPSGTIAGSATLTANAATTHAITVNVAGLSSANYSFTSDNSGLLTVTQAPITVKAEAVNREYGEPNETVTVFEYRGFKNVEGTDGDTHIDGIDEPSGTPLGTIVLTATPIAHAGTTHAITVDVSGLSSTNYSFTSDNTGLLSVTKATLVINAADVDREYGNSNETVTVFEYSGFKNSEGTSGDTNIDGIDNPSGSPLGTISATALPTAMAGTTHVITVDVSELSSTDYRFTNDNSGLLTVTRAPITVKAQAVNREYGEVNETVSIFEYRGFKNGEGTDGNTNIDDIDNPSGSPSGTIADSATPTAHAGTTHAITVDVSELSATNYSFTNDDSGLLTVTKARLVVKAQALSRYYGYDNETVVVFEYRGFKNLEGTNGGTNINGIDNPTGSPSGNIAETATLTATAGTSHTITVDVSAMLSTDYTFESDNSGELTIEKAMLIANTDVLNEGFVEDFSILGIKPPEDSDDGYRGFRNGEKRGVLISEMTISVDPGDYSQTQTATVPYRFVGGEATNYTFDSDTNDIVVHRWPVVTQQAENQRSCEGLDVQLSVNGDADSEPAYQWQFRQVGGPIFEDLNTNTTSEQFPFQFSGANSSTIQIDSISTAPEVNKDIRDFEFRALVSSLEGWGPPDTSNVVGIDSLNTPRVSFIKLKANSRILINTDESGFEYYWGVNEEVLAGPTIINQYKSENPIVSSDQARYWSETVFENGCRTRTYLLESPPRPDNSVDFSVSPNPSNGEEINITIQNTDVADVEIYIRSINGNSPRLVAQFTKGAAAFQDTFSLTPVLTRGIYIIEVRLVGIGRSVSKLIVR